MTSAVGVDIGGTKMAAAVVSSDGEILDERVEPSTVGDAPGAMEQLRRMLQEMDTPESCEVGIGIAGLVDHVGGRYLYGPNTGLRDVNLAELASETLGTRVVIDNDANCAAWGEHRFGAGRGADHFVCVTLGTGIGGGFVLSGRPYRGAFGGAAEIGHMLVDPHGPPCGCGRNGCWEQFASGSALERSVAERLASGEESSLSGTPTGREVMAAARAGDTLASELIEQLAWWLGWGLGSLVNVFEPERIAISGGMATDWDVLAQGAEAALRARAEAPDYRRLPELCVAELGPRAGMVGAALLVLDPAFSEVQP